MSEKLGLAEKMPALVTLRKGNVEKVVLIGSEADVESVLA